MRYPNTQRHLPAPALCRRYNGFFHFIEGFFSSAVNSGTPLPVLVAIFTTIAIITIV
jgi:hypothetical protein